MYKNLLETINHDNQSTWVDLLNNDYFDTISLNTILETDKFEFNIYDNKSSFSLSIYLIIKKEF